MRTSSEIKKNNIRKANLVMESSYRKDKGSVASKFGLYEQCGSSAVTSLDTDGVYMGAPNGREPMDMISGDEMGMMDFDMGMDMMDDGMDMMGGEQVDCPKCGGEGCSHCNNKGHHGMDMMDDEMTMIMMEKKLKPDSLDLDGERKSSRSVEIKKDGMVKNPKDQPSCAKLIVGGQGCYSCDGGRTFQSYPCGEEFDPEEFFNEGIGKQRELKENYKALTATPSRDSWGNKYNNILTESNQVNGINSLINRMKRVIK